MAPHRPTKGDRFCRGDHTRFGDRTSALGDASGGHTHSSTTEGSYTSHPWYTIDARQHNDRHSYRALTHTAPTIEVETMLQSMAEITYQQGIEQGARRTSIESTLAILKRRFREAEVDTLTPALEAIEDINRLKQLNLEASVIDTFHTFQERVNA